ncbi:hypothetical protein [Flavobacterium ginsenosidimutans]|uniref:HEPN domain-containing protein n=1 Tax=Flavobacterium ginsenosidimutans TaxID=687844 RepID=A0ABZ2Q9X3_9FLAO
MKYNNEEYIIISEKSQLDEWVQKFAQGQMFAKQFKFSERNLFISLLESLEIDYEEFMKRFYFFDAKRNLHIAESEFGYFWISTFGLIAKSKATNNSAVNACLTQYTVLSLLMKKSIETMNSENIYDIDRYSFGYLSELTPALFQNILFYIEVFCKAYLSLNGIKTPRTHKLSVIYQKAVETMKIRKHYNSLFQVRILEPLYKYVEHTSSIPGNFKEQFVKYDDNLEDDTVIIFQPEFFLINQGIFELSIDFITDFYHVGEKTHYLEANLYQRMLDMADTEEKKQKVRSEYRYLETNN